ncbi:MAG: SDR family NAD(P)-dependent oxidoreductase [Hyphomicrobiaceae bacterium]
MKRLDGKIALITGASRGIGAAIAKAYAREGAHCILLARTRGALEELDDEIGELGGTATLVPMNLKHDKKVDALGPSLFERFAKLDIFVANAGILGPLSPLPHVADDDWTNVLNINLTANWRLIRTLGPLLERSKAGRAIFLTSGAVTKNRAYWGPYTVSKAALEALAKTWAAEVETTDIRVNLVNPGPVATGMRAKAMPGEDPSTIPQPDDLGELFVKLALPDLTANGEVFDYTP